MKGGIEKKYFIIETYVSSYHTDPENGLQQAFG